MILGAASSWTKRKGLDVSVWLTQKLDERFAMVLVGLSPKQIRILSEGIISVQRIEPLEELACIYTVADLFLTTSQEETYGMTVAKMAVCGTSAAIVEGSACMEASEDAEQHIVA